MKTVEVLRKVELPLCDKCGCSLEWEDQHECSCTLKFDFGYNSSMDGVKGEFHFCEKCAAILLANVNFLSQTLQELWYNSIESSNKDVQECGECGFFFYEGEKHHCPRRD